jgi:hypothetical protein
MNFTFLFIPHSPYFRQGKSPKIPIFPVILPVKSRNDATKRRFQPRMALSAVRSVRNWLSFCMRLSELQTGRYGPCHFQPTFAGCGRMRAVNQWMCLIPAEFADSARDAAGKLSLKERDVSFYFVFGDL